MRIALFSDIHSNLPALEAVLKSLDDQKSDAIYCLGDLVGYNIWMNEVVDIIKSRAIPTIAGNYDFGVGRNSDDCGCAYKSDIEKAMGSISISYTNQNISDENRRYLNNLPMHIRVEFNKNGENIVLLLVHGSPRKINEYLFQDRDEKSMQRIMKDSGADIMCFGHTHKPYHRILEFDENNKKLYRHAINIGSVGKPKDGDSRACYAILSIDENSSLKNNNSISVEFIRVPYDIEKAAKAVENCRLPDEYAEMLRKAF